MGLRQNVKLITTTGSANRLQLCDDRCKHGKTEETSHCIRGPATVTKFAFFPRSGKECIRSAAFGKTLLRAPCACHAGSAGIVGACADSLQHFWG